jgi:HAD superfamily hydrolase (TIGR01549 family)
VTVPAEAVSFDLFGTLVTVNRPANTAAAIADELDAAGVPSSEYWKDMSQERWEEMYTTAHVEVAEGAELSLSRHIIAALTSHGDGIETTAIRDDVEQAVKQAFDCPVETRPDAPEAVQRLADRKPVGVLSNCSVPGLVEQTLDRSAIDASKFDAIVTSVECGWRKPHQNAFQGIAKELDVETTKLVHVGDDAVADGGISDVGGRFVHTEKQSLTKVTELVTDGWQAGREASER